jgi:hypothetical protein
VTRNRINIDVDDHMDAWISLTAKVAGVSKTETARALLGHMQDNHLADPLDVSQRVEAHRRSANQARGRRAHQTPPKSPRARRPG